MLDVWKGFSLTVDELQIGGFFDWHKLKCFFMASILLPLAHANFEFVGFNLHDSDVS